MVDRNVVAAELGGTVEPPASTCPFDVVMASI